MRLKGKKILLGITASIASYKAFELIRMFRREGAEVKTVLTPAALEFVTVKTLETLTMQPVYVDQFAPKANTEHISLAQWADLMVIAPLSANTLAKMANGICDNLLTSLFSALFGDGKRVIVAPAMNCGMWKNPFTDYNVKKLEKHKIEIIYPETGFLACEKEGVGRLCAVEKVYNAVEKAFGAKILEGKKVIVTAGGTKEPIDSVRHLSNASSGKMGTAVADAAYALGADVELISTFDIARNYTVVRVESASDMQKALQESFPSADVLVMAAAVADFRAKNYSEQKISSDGDLTLELVKNPDILEEICKTKRTNQTVIGFCLSTENVTENAKKKIDKKGCDYIVANEAKTALGKDETEVWLVDKAHNIEKFETDSKENIAFKLLERIYDKN